MSRTPPARPYPRTISSPDCADPTGRGIRRTDPRPAQAFNRRTDGRGHVLCEWSGCSVPGDGEGVRSPVKGHASRIGAVLTPWARGRVHVRAVIGGRPAFVSGAGDRVERHERDVLFAAAVQELLLFGRCADPVHVLHADHRGNRLASAVGLGPSPRLLPRPLVTGAGAAFTAVTVWLRSENHGRAGRAGEALQPEQFPYQATT